MADRAIEREIQVINPLYFLFWDEKGHWWEIRRWRNERWKRVPAKDRKFTIAHSEFVRRCVYTDDQGHIIGYRPVDQRFVYEFKRGLYNARRIKYFLQEIDDANKKMERQKDAEQDYQHRAAAKSIYHHYQEPTVHLGGS